MYRKFTAAAFLLGASALANGLAAQESTRTIVLDPIVLTAGTEKVASSVPQSVSVVGPEQLRETAPDTIGDALKQVPGVAGVGSASFFGQGFNIRGFGSSGSAASEAGIVQLLDGEKKYFESYRQGSLFVEPDFLKRVEVLRGPGSSTLYGSGALGGVIAMETIDASDLIRHGNNGGRIKLGYSSNPDTRLGSIAWGWRPTDDFEALAAFAYRKLGSTKDVDGTTLIRSNSGTPNLLLKAKKTFGDQYIEGSYQHLEARGKDQDFNQLEGSQAGVIFGPPGTPPFRGWGVGNITTRDQVARLEWGWNPADNRLIDASATLSYTNSIKETEQGTKADEPVFASLLGRRDYALYKLKAQNVMDLSGTGYSHFLTLGVETFKQDRSSTRISSAHPEGYTRSLAVYGWSELEYGNFTVNTGLRLERQKTEPKGSVTISDESVTASSVEPQIGVMYRLTEQWSVFGSAAMVNRLPVIDELYDGFLGGAPSPDLKDEHGRNIEAGVSYRGHDVFGTGDEAAMKLTVFKNDITDMIVRTGEPAPTPSYTNIARAELYGGELEASYLTGDLQFAAGLSVVGGKDENDETLDTLPNNRLTLAASWQVSDDWKIGARSLLAAGRDKPRGDRRTGYGVHDIFAIWAPQDTEMEGVEVNFGVDNVFNRDYTPATYLTGPAPGRNIKLSLSKSF